MAGEILKAKERDLRIAERKKQLVPLAAVRSHVERPSLGCIRQSSGCRPATLRPWRRNWAAMPTRSMQRCRKRSRPSWRCCRHRSFAHNRCPPRPPTPLSALPTVQGDAGVAEIGQELRGWLESGGDTDLAEALGARRVNRLDGANLEARDTLLRAVAAKHFSGWPSLSSRADRLRDALGRYAATDSRRSDQGAAVCPYEPDTRAADFWQILRLSGHVPSPRTLRRLLATGDGCGQPNG